MQKRHLGCTGLEVSAISFGAWQLGNHDAWGGMDDSTALNLVAEALDRGVNLFDTAPNYAAGRSESLLGQALRGKRGQIVLVSKFGHQPSGEQDFSTAAFQASLEQSLRRLQTDYLDVLLLHNPPARFYTGQDLLWEALDRTRQQGKIRHYGASLDYAKDIETCLSYTQSEVLEVLFNIFHQDVRRAFPLVRSKQVGLLAKVPLDSGWLAGHFNPESCFSGVRQRWSKGEIRQRAELVSALDWLTADGSPLAQKALAYLLAYDEVSCVIPGVRNLEQLQENLAATEAVVTVADREWLEMFWNGFSRDGKDLLPW